MVSVMLDAIDIPSLVTDSARDKTGEPGACPSRCAGRLESPGGSVDVAAIGLLPRSTSPAFGSGVRLYGSSSAVDLLQLFAAN